MFLVLITDAFDANDADGIAQPSSQQLKCDVYHHFILKWQLGVCDYIPFSGKPHVECGVALLKAQDSRAREVMAVIAECLSRLEAVSTHQGAELLQRLQVHEQTPASFFAASLEPQAGTFIQSTTSGREFLFGCSSHPHLLLKETE